MLSTRLPLCLSGLILALGLVSGCVAPGPTIGSDAKAENFNDPYEETNRSIFNFNQVVDRNVLVPVAKTYRTVVPPPMQQSLHDLMQNLDEPLIFTHDVLQGQLGLARDSFGRLAINTTVGIGGLFDVATQVGVPYHTNDLGITLATLGVPEGPYLMVPVIGPSNPRDLIGKVGDGFADPGNIVASNYNIWYAPVARAALEGIDARSRNIETLADIERTSLDYYATIRSLYRQRRAAQIRHEQENLPNPSPLQGSDSGPALSYSYTPSPRF